MRLAAAALSFALSLPAAAGSISGVVIDKASGSAISGMTVRLWLPVYVTDANGTRVKSWSIGPTTPTTPGYSFGGLAPGRYLVDTLPGAGLPFEYTDRWYAPGEATDDLAGFVDATQLDGSLNNTGIDIYVLRGGGIDGIVVDPSFNLLNGVLVRAELAGTPAVHHNDTSGKYAEHPGEFSFRNLVPSGSDGYQFLTYRLLGDFETMLTPGVAVSSGVDVTLGSAVQMFATSPAATADPYNGLDHDISAVYPLGRAPHAVFRTSVDSPSHAAIIAPLGADVDSFCFPANPGDRFKLEAHAAAILGSARVNPWFDPVMRFSGPGLPLPGFRTYDDDDGGGLDALIQDTGELPGGTYCARVSAFGDSGVSGSGGNSTGRFDFTATLLNRRPTLSTSVPSQPAWTEGGTVTINLSFQDADGDSLTPSATLVDANDAPDPTFSIGSITGSGAVFTWTIPAGASNVDPYVATFTVTDSAGDVDSTSLPISQLIAIAPLATPLQIAPDDGARLATVTPSFVIQDVPDDTQTNLFYEFELYDHTGALMAQSGSVPVDPSGQMVFTPAPLPENEQVSWRVRAVHGSAHSAWSVFRHLLIDVTNEPPPAPVLVKPLDGDEVMTRQPGFSASVDPDPEGDAVSLVFQLASDDAFAQIVETGAPVPVTLANLTTPWTPATVLAWGGTYYARVYAVDALGAQSGFSNVVSFSVRPDALPAPPPLEGTFAQSCHGGELKSRPPSISVGNVQDPDGEAVTLELQLLDFTSGSVLLDVSQAQSSGATTAMDVSTMKWTEDAHYTVQARAGDGTLSTPWTSCDFTLDEVPDEPPPATDGGTTPPAADGGTNPPIDGAHRSGCSSGALGALAVLGLLALLRRRSVNVQ